MEIEEIPLTAMEKLQLDNLNLKAQLLMTQMALIEKERDLTVQRIYAEHLEGAFDFWEIDLQRGVLKWKEETNGDHNNG